MGKKSVSRLSGTIGWYSNSPTIETGYGVQTGQVVSRMKRSGLDVAVFSNYGAEGSESSWNSGFGAVPVYPRGNETYSNDVVPAHYDNWCRRNPNERSALITLYDVWVLKGKQYDKLNVGSWVPVDHMPVPPDVLRWLAKPNVTPIAMSKYGQAIIQNSGLDAEYVPHAIEEVFRPTANIGEQTAREFLGVDKDTFLVGMNAANKGIYPNRKCFGENLLAFKMFADKHPDSVLYLHTDVLGSGGGIMLTDLIAAAGLRQEQVLVADPYEYRMGYSSSVLAAIYSAFDVLLATSLGEGFGVPTIEAQGCGTPVIVTDFAASSELVGDGWRIPGQPLWDAPQRSWFMTPRIDSIVEALSEAYNRERGTSQAAVDFAENYRAEKVWQEHWLPVLDRLLSKRV